jgi:hypothetical protein
MPQMICVKKQLRYTLKQSNNSDWHNGVREHMDARNHTCSQEMCTREEKKNRSNWNFEMTSNTANIPASSMSSISTQNA